MANNLKSTGKIFDKTGINKLLVIIIYYWKVLLFKFYIYIYILYLNI